MLSTIKNINLVLWNFLVVTLPQPANKAQWRIGGGGCSCAASAALFWKALSINVQRHTSEQKVF